MFHRRISNNESPSAPLRNGAPISRNKWRTMEGTNVEDLTIPKSSTMTSMLLPRGPYYTYSGTELITDYGERRSRDSSHRRFYFRTRFPCISHRESRTRPLCRHGHVIRARVRE